MYLLYALIDPRLAFRINCARRLSKADGPADTLRFSVDRTTYQAGRTNYRLFAFLIKFGAGVDKMLSLWLTVGAIAASLGSEAVQSAEYSGPPLVAKKRPEVAGTAVRMIDPPEEKKTAQPPADDVVNQQVDAALARWSSAWMIDRYVRGSSRVVERALEGTDYFIQGSFAFDRGVRKFTIPFGALFTHENNSYQFTKLCYQDDSSGMRDCVDPIDGIAQRQVQANQTRQLLTAIAIAGLVVAVTTSDGPADSRPSSGTTGHSRKKLCSTEYSYSAPGMIGYEDNGPGARGTPYLNCSN